MAQLKYNDGNGWIPVLNFPLATDQTPGIIKVQNNLITTETGSALDATQGKILNDKIDTFKELILNLGLEFVEKYNAKWLKIYYTDSQSGTILFSTKAELESSFSSYKWSIMGMLPHFYKEEFGGYEFLLEYPSLSGYNRWSQTSNPLYTTAVSNYRAISLSWTENSWGGMALSSSASTWIDGSPGTTDWWYAIGQRIGYGGGIPGPNSTIIQQCALYIRIA